MPKEQQKTQIGGKDEQPEFYGMDQVLSVFADAFMVSRSAGAYTLCFFQSQMPEKLVGPGRHAISGTKHKCVGKIVLASQASLDKFLEVVANTQDPISKLPSPSNPQTEGHQT